MKLLSLLLSCALLFSVLPVAQVSAQSSTESSGKNTTELKSELEGKTKSEVKNLFGRAPDEVTGSMWVYVGQYLDPDAEKVMRQCLIIFNDGDKAFMISFVE